MRICNPHALNIGICNPARTALFVRICNPHGLNIGIYNPKKLSFRIKNASILFRRIANPTERPQGFANKDCKSDGTSQGLANMNCKSDGTGLRVLQTRPQGYINKGTGLYHQPYRILQTRAKGFGGTMWSAEFEAVHCVPDDHCERTLAVHPHAMLHSRFT